MERSIKQIEGRPVGRPSFFRSNDLECAPNAEMRRELERQLLPGAVATAAESVIDGLTVMARNAQFGCRQNRSRPDHCLPGPSRSLEPSPVRPHKPGPFPTMLMVDLGAEVIKIEVPDGGDFNRTSGELKGEISSFFETNNRDVKSITLNLQTDQCRTILYELVKTVDVFS